MDLQQNLQYSVPVSEEHPGWKECKKVTLYFKLALSQGRREMPVYFSVRKANTTEDITVHNNEELLHRKLHGARKKCPWGEVELDLLKYDAM